MPLNSIIDVASAFEAAGKGLASFVDAIQKLVVSGTRGFDVIKARRMESRLRDISARGTQLAVTQAGVVDEIADYLKNPAADKWSNVTDQLDEILVSVIKLLSEVEQERSEYVTESSYELLMSSLNSRAGLITGLIDLPAPQQEDELRALEMIRLDYQKLIGQLREARDALNDYLKQKE